MSTYWLATATALDPAPAHLAVVPSAIEKGEGVEMASVPLSFDAVYEAHFDFVWRNLRRLGVEPSSVDDAAHDVFLVVHRQLDRFDGRNPKSWLFAIAQRVAWHYRRSVARRRTEPLAERELRADSTDSPDELQAKRQACVLVQQLLDQLPEDRRVVFVLAELEQLSMPEIAALLRIPLNTAYSRLRLARRDFSRSLGRHEISTQNSRQSSRRSVP